MKSVGIDPCGHTKSLLIKFHTLNKDFTEAINLVNEESDYTVTRYMFSSAIAACGTDWQQALALLQRSNALNKADEAVFTATAQCCARNNQYDKAFRVIDAMLLRGLPFNKYSFSFAINACLEYQIKGNDALNYLDRYLSIASDRYPVLLTNAVCQKVVRDLLLCRKPVAAAIFHLGPLAHTTCKSDTLGVLLKDLQLASEELHIQNIYAKQIKNENNIIIKNKMKNEYYQKYKNIHEDKNENENENENDNRSITDENNENIITMKEKKAVEVENKRIVKEKKGEAIEIGEKGNENENELELEELEEEKRRNKEMKDLAQRGLALIALYCSTNTVRSQSAEGYYMGNIDFKLQDNKGFMVSDSFKEEQYDGKYDRLTGKGRGVGVVVEVGGNEIGQGNKLTEERVGGEGKMINSREWSGVRAVSTDIPTLPRRHLLRISHFNRYVRACVCMCVCMYVCTRTYRTYVLLLVVRVITI